MKFFNIVTGLTLILNFCESNGEGFIVISKYVSKMFKSADLQTFSNPYCDLSEIKKKYMCGRIRNYKIIAHTDNSNSSFYLKRTDHFSRIVNDEFVTAKNSFPKLYKRIIPSLACRNKTSVIYMTYSSTYEMDYVFGKFFNDAPNKMVLAVYKPYLKIREPRKHFADLFEIPSDETEMKSLQIPLTCASVFEHFAPAEMDQKSQYAVRASIVSKPVTYSSFIKIRDKNFLLKRVMCKSFIVKENITGSIILSYIVSFYEKDRKRLLVVTDEYVSKHVLIEKIIN